MTTNTPTIKTLHNLLDYDVQKIISAEIQLKNSLPGWMDKANSVKLKLILQKYFDLVQEHIQKMEGFFADERMDSLHLTNRVIHAFIEELEERLNNCSDAEVRDASLLAWIQNINHYKVCTYGTAAAFANALGMEKQAGVFHQIEVNEKQIDDRLTQLAEFEVNAKAKTTVVLPK